jgi:hypothetical protein
MNLARMLKDLSKLKHKWHRIAEDGETVGPNYAGKFTFQGICLAIEVVTRHVYGEPSRRLSGKPYASSSDQLKEDRHA